MELLARLDLNSHWVQWIGPVLFIVGGFTAGWICERLLVAGLQKLLLRASIELNRQVVKLLQGMVLGLFTLGGTYMATYNVSEGLVSSMSMEVTRKLLFIIGMLVVIQLSAKLSVALVRFYLTRLSHAEALPNTSIFEHILSILVYVFGFLMLLQTLGISVVPLITALGVGGLAISLALQDTLANVFAGINMILARQIKVGDFVMVEGNYEGFIQDIGWRNTIIRQLSNNLIIIPNGKVASSVITNYALPLPEMSTLVEVRVAYSSDLALVQEVTIDVAKSILSKTTGGVADFEPFIRYHTFADHGIQFTVILRVNTLVDQYLVKHEFVKALHQRYQDEGIEIPLPQRVLNLSPELNRTVLERLYSESMEENASLSHAAKKR